MNQDKYEKLLDIPFRMGGRMDRCSCGQKYNQPKEKDCELCGGFVDDGLYLDCYGLAIEVYKINDIILPAKTSLTNDEMICAALIEGSCDYQELPGPEPLSIVSLKVMAPFVTHIGVVLEDTEWFIHILEQHKVSIERLRRKQKMIDGYWRYVGFNNSNSNPE
jgi:hypothetical protein